MAILKMENGIQKVFKDFKSMFGHNAVKLARLNNIKNSLNASVNWINVILKDPKIDVDLYTLETLVKDALQNIEEIDKKFKSEE